MNDSEDTGLEVRRLRRLLKQMYILAEHSSLTGALTGGAVDAVEQYNRILSQLEELNLTTTLLFLPLPTDAAFDRLGVASKLLESYLTEETPEGNESGSTGTSHKVIIGGVSGMDDLKEMGRLLRENLPGFLQQRMSTAREAPVPAVPPTPNTPPTPTHQE